MSEARGRVCFSCEKDASERRGKRKRGSIFRLETRELKEIGRYKEKVGGGRNSLSKFVAAYLVESRVFSCFLLLAECFSARSRVAVDGIFAGAENDAFSTEI